MRLTFETPADDLNLTADEKVALRELESLLEQRVAEADKGAVSALSVMEIFEDELRKAR